MKVLQTDRRTKEETDGRQQVIRKVYLIFQRQLRKINVAYNKYHYHCGFDIKITQRRNRTHIFRTIGFCLKYAYFYWYMWSNVVYTNINLDIVRNETKTWSISSTNINSSCHLWINQWSIISICRAQTQNRVQNEKKSISSLNKMIVPIWSNIRKHHLQNWPHFVQAAFLWRMWDYTMGNFICSAYSLF